MDFYAYRDNKTNKVESQTNFDERGKNVCVGVEKTKRNEQAKNT